MKVIKFMKYFVLVMTTLFLGVAPVWAIPPETNSLSLSFNDCPDGEDPNPFYECGNGLVLCQLLDVEVNYKIFFDNNGDEVRYHELTSISGGLFEQGNPGNFLPYKASTFTAEYDFIENMTSYAGNYLMLTVPGYGQIFRDVGRISGEGWGVYPPYTFYAGDHQWFDVVYLGEDDAEAVCEYMAGH